MKRIIHISILAVSLFTSGTIRSEEPNLRTIKGTWTWKVGSEAEKPKKPDFWWEHVSETERYLVPQGGTVAAIVERDFDAIDQTFAKTVKMSDKRISGQQLRPGSVLVFKTGAGKFGKLRVKGYSGSFDITEYDIHLEWLWTSRAG